MIDDDVTVRRLLRMPNRDFVPARTLVRACCALVLLSSAGCGGGGPGSPPSSPEAVTSQLQITTPTTAATFASTAPQISLGGTASGAGVTRVAWTNSRGGNGEAVGTTTWTAAGISLSAGTNVITVVASNASGNVGSDTLTVDYTPDATAPTVEAASPAAGAADQSASLVPSITFSEAMDPNSLNESTVRILDASQNVVRATMAYDASTRTVALDPIGALSHQSQYTLSVIGGATEPRVKDLAGNALEATFTGSFTTAAPTGACNSNAITAENCLTGHPASEWDIVGAGHPSIQGFATDISVNRGETVSFKVNTDASAYRLDIYRMGYYGGMGARRVATVQPSASLPQAQPSCLNQVATGLIDCGNWAVSASWAVPANSTSGIYFAKLVRTDNGNASHIFFIVRDDASTSDVLFQTSDTTWQAYNDFGGNSFYGGMPAGRAYKLSYNRPFSTRGSQNGQGWVFNAEYPMVRWLEANGYDVSYTTGIDSDRRGELIRNHKLFTSNGHDEYWSAAQRAHVEAAREAGVHLAFFSGNDVFWKTRWENSIDAAPTAYRTLVCYKETHANAKIDPTEIWTGTWRDPRFSPPSDGDNPENALTGTLFMVNDGGVTTNTAIRVPEPDGKMRFWRNTSIASLAPGAVPATLAAGTLGFEWDVDVENDSRPPGLIRLSTTTESNLPVLLDHGSTFSSNGSATHHMTLYRHPSGALVFDSGTIQWAWGLDEHHDRPMGGVDARVQQATVNLFADMGVQPARLQAGLTSASMSSDVIAPSVAVTSPSSGATLVVGSPIAIIGTAADAGEGRVAGVEVSLDDGVTWRPATGRGAWTYRWTPSAVGSVTARVRAVDDSGRMDTEGTRLTFNVVAASSANCPCSVWSPYALPLVTSYADPVALELGMRFSSTVAGRITGVRFYKGPNNTGTHVGSLWSAAGARLVSGTFVNETATGWQTLMFTTPYSITANTQYVISYFAPNGGYARDAGYFVSSDITNGPLVAPRSLAGPGNGNGVYAYGASSVFPGNSFDGTNYWVDPIFEPQ